jgi:uncharacterized protein (UPF0297 family)
MTVYTEETIDFNIKSGNKKDAMKTISQIYSEDTNEVHKTIYNDLKDYYDNLAE